MFCVYLCLQAHVYACLYEGRWKGERVTHRFICVIASGLEVRGQFTGANFSLPTWVWEWSDKI